MPVDPTDAIISGLLEVYGGEADDHQYVASIVHAAIEECGLQIVPAEATASAEAAHD